MGHAGPREDPALGQFGVPKAKKEAPEEELPPLVAEDELDDGPDAAIEEDEDDEADPIDVPASAAGKASALRLLDMLVEKEALALSAKKPGPSLIEAVAKVLESPGSLSARATKLSDAIVDSEDVDDLFVDDDVLVEILKRW
jgi:hypothetical protein